MIQNIGNIRYDYNVKITTSGSVNDASVALNADAVSLIIRDNVFQPFENAFLTINDASKSIQCSGNGDDVVDINITMLDEAATPFSQSPWMSLRSKFYVIDNKTGKDSIQLELQHSLESDLFKSADVNSADIAGAADATLLSDDERAAYTGDIIKAILTQVLGPQYIAPNFNRGNRKKFYYSTANERALHSVCYLRNIHTCEKNMPCLLSHNAYTDTISFVSLAEIFKNQQQHMMGESFVYAAKAAGYDLKNKITKLPVGAGPILTNFSEIKQEPQIVPHVKAYTNLANSRTVIADRANKTLSNFAISTQEKTQEFNRLFVEPFKKLYNVSPVFTPSVDKQAANAYSKPVFTPESSNFNAVQESNNMIKHLLFGGNVLKFSVMGAPWRRSGTFIDIITQGASSQEYSKKIMGRWFVSHVDHIFTRSQGYVNYIECVRPYNLA